MSVMTNYFETLVLDAFRGTTKTAPLKVYGALFLSDPTETGTAGTEVSYTGYARREVSLAAPSTNGVNVTTQNLSQVIFATPPAAAGTVTHFGIVDSSAAGNVLVYKQLSTPITLTSETAPRFAAGEIALAMNGGNLDPSFKVKIFNFLRGANLAGFSPYIAMFDGDPMSGGTELSGAGYARMALIFDTPTEQVSGQMQSQNTNAVQSAEAGANWGIYAYGVIMTAQTAGDKTFYKANVAGYSMNNGAQAYIAAGSIKIALN